MEDVVLFRTMGAAERSALTDALYERVKEEQSRTVAVLERSLAWLNDRCGRMSRDDFWTFCQSEFMFRLGEMCQAFRNTARVINPNTIGPFLNDKIPFDVMLTRQLVQQVLETASGVEARKVSLLFVTATMATFINTSRENELPVACKDIITVLVVFEQLYLWLISAPLPTHA